MSGSRLSVAWRSRALPGSRDGASLWIGAILVIVVVYFSPKHVLSASTAITGLLGLAALALAARRPDRSLIVLVVVLPFQGFLLARLWAWGVPASVVRHLGAWKEVLAIGVILAALRHEFATGGRADALDRVGLAIVAIMAIYLVAEPTIIPSSHAKTSVRLLAFRQDAGFILLLLAARRVPFPPGFLDRLGRTVLAVCAVVAGVCVFEALDSGGWNHFVVHTIGSISYQRAILHSTPSNLSDIRFYGTIGGTQIVRAGSVFLSPLTCGFYLVIGFALGLERAARGVARPWHVLALVLIGAGLLLTQTRSAILAGLVVALVTFTPAAGRRSHWRTQLALVIAALAILAVPAVFSTGLAQRVSGTTGKGNQDTAGHVSGFWTGVDTLTRKPLGTGLGTSAGIGQRFASGSQVVVPENNYLEIGLEVGVIPMLLFAVLTVALVQRLRRAARRHPDAVVAATASAAVGLAIAAWFLQTWLDFGVSWTFWGLAGVALGASRLSALPPQAPRNMLETSSEGRQPKQAVLA